MEEFKASRMPPFRSAVGEVRNGRVVVVIGEDEIELPPAAARTWARSVLHLADVAEAEGERG